MGQTCEVTCSQHKLKLDVDLATAYSSSPGEGKTTGRSCRAEADMVEYLENTDKQKEENKRC
jgi:hypothetical protein